MLQRLGVRAIPGRFAVVDERALDHRARDNSASHQAAVTIAAGLGLELDGVALPDGGDGAFVVAPLVAQARMKGAAGKGDDVAFFVCGFALGALSGCRNGAKRCSTRLPPAAA